MVDIVYSFSRIAWKRLTLKCAASASAAVEWTNLSLAYLHAMASNHASWYRAKSTTAIMTGKKLQLRTPHHFLCLLGHCLSIVGCRHFSSMSTGCEALLRGDWAIGCHVGSERVSRVRPAGENPLNYFAMAANRTWTMKPNNCYFYWTEMI